jgi:hypothetical protein
LKPIAPTRQEWSRSFILHVSAKYFGDPFPIAFADGSDTLGIADQRHQSVHSIRPNTGETMTMSAVVF